MGNNGEITDSVTRIGFLYTEAFSVFQPADLNIF